MLQIRAQNEKWKLFVTNLSSLPSPSNEGVTGGAEAEDWQEIRREHAVEAPSVTENLTVAGEDRRRMWRKEKEKEKEEASVQRGELHEVVAIAASDGTERCNIYTGIWYFVTLKINRTRGCLDRGRHARCAGGPAISNNENLSI